MAKQHLVRSLLPEVGRSELRHPPSAPLPSARKSLPSTAVGEAHHELADGETEAVGAALGTRRLLSARSLINRVQVAERARHGLLPQPNMLPLLAPAQSGIRQAK